MYYAPVRHVLQKKDIFLTNIRLACVKCAASVHSEPESNSSVLLIS